jgi:hypothetical protein
MGQIDLLFKGSNDDVSAAEFGRLDYSWNAMIQK